MFSKQLRYTTGFTLLELLVVVAIIGLLAAYVGPRYLAQIGRSEQAVARSQIEGFTKALHAYRIDVGQYPSTQEGLNALTNAPTDTALTAKWRGPYLEKAVPNDPWSRPYIYRNPGAQGVDFEITSLGQDGQVGGSGDAADVSSR